MPRDTCAAEGGPESGGMLAGHWITLGGDHALVGSLFLRCRNSGNHSECSRGRFLVRLGQDLCARRQGAFRRLEPELDQSARIMGLSAEPTTPPGYGPSERIRPGRG